LPDYDHDGSLLVYNLIDKIPGIQVVMGNDIVTDEVKNDRFMLDFKEWLNFVWDNVANVLWPLPTDAGQTMVSHQNVRRQQAAQRAAQPIVARAVAAVAEFVGGGDSTSEGGSGSTGSSSTRGPRSDRQRVAEKMREYILEVDSLLFSDGQRCKLSSSNNHTVLLNMHEHIRKRYTTPAYRALHERNQMAAEIARLQQGMAPLQQQLAQALVLVSQYQANQFQANQALANQAPGVVDDESEGEQYEV
jgi:hypothetical protein